MAGWTDARVVMGVAMLLAGCAGTQGLMATPAVYLGATAKPLFTSAGDTRDSSPVDLLYITDRAPGTTADGGLAYTSDRSESMAFGSVEVEIGKNVDWKTLVTESMEEERKLPLELELGTVRELGRFPLLPYLVDVTPMGVARSPAVVDAHEQAATGLQTEVARRLAIAQRKEVVLFVHGYENTFEDSAFTMADFCHFLGREFVCGIFSWPAGGSRGLMAGYNVDYESSEFATQHLKQAIRLIAQTPGVERIHLIAHSRGTDLLATVLRELHAEAYMSGRSFGEAFKVKNVVFVAPDIDMDVAATKLLGVVSDPDMPFEKAPRPRGVLPGPDAHLTVYVSRSDKALTLSQFLFGSRIRLGRLDEALIPPARVKRMASFAFTITYIEVPVTPGLIGHSYFVSDPAVSADLIEMIRYDLEPGQPGRPLELIEPPFWRIPPSD